MERVLLGKTMNLPIGRRKKMTIVDVPLVLPRFM